MRFTEYSFGSVRVDRVTCDHDLIIDRGKTRKRSTGGRVPGSLLSGAAGTISPMAQ